MRKWWQRVQIWLGKRCPDDQHSWRKLYGDERMARSALYVCKHCGATGG